MPRRRRVTRKRRTRKSGTTGDRKPQYLTGTVSCAGTAVYATTILEVPLLNILSGGTKVLEILKIELNRTSGSNQVQIALGSRALSGVSTTTYPYTNVGADRVWFANTIINAGANSFTFDLTDEAGNGQLYPAQQVAFNILGTATEQFQVRLLYRIKNASMSEYVGVINQYVASNF
jgi:hypothetical protein